MYSRRRSVRAWRLRGRRGQVSAIATIFGLLIVVTFIANYLTTTLPQQMSVNDLNHVVQVEDQIGRLSALLESATEADAVGAEFTQPISLGSAGQPPFASADPGTLSPPTNGSSFNLTLPIGGTWYYNPPSAPFASKNLTYSNPGGGCTKTTSSVTCTGTSYLFWNVSTSATNYALSVANGVYDVNVEDSGASTAAPATLTTTLTGDGTLNYVGIGNNGSTPITMSAAGTGTINIEIIGNYDNVSIADTSGGGNVNILFVGLHDTVWVSKGAGLTLLVEDAGSSDSVGLTTSETYLNANTVASVYFLSDSSGATACPNGLNAETDWVYGGHAPVTTAHGHGGSTTTYYGDYNVTYNVTTLPVTLTTAPPYAIWESTNNSLTAEAEICPFFSQHYVPTYWGASGGGFSVHLASSYIPQADIALDEGGVVYAQQGGVPIMLDPPGFSATWLGSTLTSLTLWFPSFIGTVPTDYGLSTSEVEARLLSVSQATFLPTSLNDIADGSFINVTVVSPFAAGWVNYWNSTVPWDYYNFGCSGPSDACNGPYAHDGPLATAWIDIPTTYQLQSVTVQVAVFAISVV